MAAPVPRRPDGRREERRFWGADRPGREATISTTAPCEEGINERRRTLGGMALWIVVATVVVLLAAGLLITILLTARGILAEAVRAERGRDDSQEHATVWELQTTNQVAEQILHTVEAIEQKGGALVRALEGQTVNRTQRSQCQANQLLRKSGSGAWSSTSSSLSGRGAADDDPEHDKQIRRRRGDLDVRSEGGQQHHPDSAAGADQPLRHQDSGFGGADGRCSGRCRAARRFLSALPDVRSADLEAADMNIFVILMTVTLVGVRRSSSRWRCSSAPSCASSKGSAARPRDSSAPSTISRRFASAFERSRCTPAFIAPQVTQLNQTLTSIRDGLRAIDASQRHHPRAAPGAAMTEQSMFPDTVFTLWIVTVVLALVLRSSVGLHAGQPAPRSPVDSALRAGRRGPAQAIAPIPAAVPALDSTIAVATEVLAAAEGVRRSSTPWRLCSKHAPDG